MQDVRSAPVSRSARLGSIGLGWWGGVLAKAAASTESTVVAGCFARSSSARESFAATHSCEPYDSLEGLLASDLDGVLIATPHTTHADLIVEAAGAGKHVFVDKPLALTTADADRAIAVVEAAGVALQVGHNRRRQPANRRLAQLIRGGELGDLVELTAVHHAPLLLNPSLAPWRRKREESPAGGMTALGVHQVDTFHYLAGPITKVVAVSERNLPHEEVDSVTMVDLVFASGVVGHLSTSMATGPVVDVTVHGTRAIARNRQDGARLTIQESGTMEEVDQKLDDLDTIADELNEFGRVVAGEAVPETGATEGRAAVAVMEAIVASLDGGGWATVDYGRP